ncbi:hypothetical protein HBH70_196540 [Parastagonospora nodorum]|nr:hypothetical protein HBI10_216940 [Parastagonospora nodorum]KAH4010255.1 hypothetical protein HBI13_211440 [Parastagonospora nodorum]KAH4201682.1 hypothetical protein HBH42_033280 [Parastagonospora nodorum]KAH4230818.1 hypothetical protein HBI05_186260 [Parastagonospora nodorum]KAH4244366.1 hypothetical protein HBI06_000790 [Parastagonospora nodorum]
MADDSPLSIAANIIGIITFVLAIAAAAYARWLWLKSQITLPYELIAQDYERVGHYIRETGILEEQIDFTPSQHLEDLIGDVHLHLIIVVLEMVKLTEYTASERIRIGNTARFFEYYGGIEYKIEMMRTLYAREQINAGFARLRKQVSMQFIKDPDLQQLQGPDLDNPLHADARVKREYRWSRSWRQAACRMSAPELAQVGHMRVHTYDDFTMLAYQLIESNIKRAVMARSRFTSYV